MHNAQLGLLKKFGQPVVYIHVSSIYYEWYGFYG